MSLSRARQRRQALLRAMLLPDPVTGETPDHTIGIYLLSAFGYTEKVPVYEVAPCTVVYDPSEPTYTSKTWKAALADNKGRIRVVVDTLPAGWVPTTPLPVDIAKILGNTLSHSNPVIARLTSGTAFIDPRDRNWALDQATDGVAIYGDDNLVVAQDQYGNLYVVPYGSRGEFLQQSPIDSSLLVREQNPLTSISVSNFPADYPDADVKAEVLKPTAPTLYNVAMANANQEYPQSHTGTVRAYEISTQDRSEFRFAWAMGKVAGPTAPYRAIKANEVYYKENVKLLNPTFYFASGSAGKVVELEVWT